MGEFKRNKINTFLGSGNLTPEDEELRGLRRENADLKEKVEIFKNSGLLCEKSKIKRFEFMKKDLVNQYGKIDQTNPATRLAYKFIEIVVKVLVTMIRLFFTVGVGILIFINRNIII